MAVRSVSVRPMRNRRQKRVEARVADETGPMVAGLVQPALARPPAGRGHGAAPSRKAAPSQPVLGDRARGDRRAAECAGVHTLGLVPVYPASQGITPERLRTLGVGRLGTDPRRRRAAAWPAARGRRARRAPGRARRDRTSPTSPRIPRTHGTGSPSRSSSCSSSRSPAASARAPSGASARELPGTGELVDPWLTSLPFTPTSDQRRAIERIDRDIATAKPMQRLLMGEVG